MARISRRRRSTLIDLATSYAAASDDEALVIPEDLTTLSDDELTALQATAGEAFDALYGDGSEALSDEDTATLTALTIGIEALAAEDERREGARTERRDEVAALAARRNAALSGDTAEDGGETPEDAEEDADADAEADDAEDDADAASEDEGAAETVTAAGRGTLSINLASASRRTRRGNPKPKAGDKPTMRDLAFATSDTLGYGQNAAVDFGDAGIMLDKRISTFSKGSYEAAAARGQHIREQHSFMAIRRPIAPEFMVASGSSIEDADRAIKAAVNMSRLPGGTLTAAGWCSPSEVMYDICLTASRDGLLSIPEVGVSRGGIKVPVQPSFAALYAAIGFHFTEAQAIAGEFAPGATPGAPNVVGDKPCVEVECPTWEDYRLEADGLCITGDFLQNRGYPEAQAWTVEAALIAHDHKVSAGRIAAIVAGSTPITMTAGTVGTTAPLLAAIELEAEHIRYSGRLSRNTLLEGIFPFWIRGAIRQDLSVRLGVDLLSVTNAQIDAWFTQRGIVPQYVYDWQALDMTAAGAFKTWPTTMQFVIYEAGAWIGGVDNIVTLDTVYDSTLLGQNKYTALFTEEAWLVAPRCGESRVVTVPIWSDGSTHAGVLLENTLAPTPAA